jgi:uncharacterized membrane protein YccC
MGTFRCFQCAAVTEAHPSQLRPEGRADPRLVALRRAARAAVVVPATFAFSLLVIRSAQFTTFAVFGCFALLVMANFGGNRQPRAIAYVVTTLAGAVLVALGTLVSPDAPVGAIVMLVVGFALSFAGVFGGYLVAAQTALLLAFVLSVSISASAAAVPARVGGWMLAGIVSTLAGLFVWPWFERTGLRRRAAEACAIAADLVEVLHAGPSADQLASLQKKTRTAMEAMRGEYARTTMRPAGPTRRDRALVELMTQLEEVVDVSERPLHGQGLWVRPCIDEGSRLEAATSAALRGSAAALTGGKHPDIRAIVEARRAHRAALNRWAQDALRSGRAAEDVLLGIDLDHTLRVVAYITIGLAANAVIAAGGHADDAFSLPGSTPLLEGARGVGLRTVQTIRAHLEPTSTVLHSSVRVGVGLALAVLLARTLGLAHAFWVVLGTLSVLRSNALGTGRTAVEALTGTVIGFVVGGLFAFVAGNEPVVMWIAMPVVVFLASYASSASSFVAGQAAFTLTVIVIFNLLAPAGWQVGLIRVEDVALGTGISVLVGLLLWPRGARHDLTRSTSVLYRAVANYLHRAFDLVLRIDGAADVGRLRADAVRARERAGEAFDVFLNERGAKSLKPHVAGRMLSAGNQALLAADLLVVVAADLRDKASGCPDSVATVGAQVRILLAGFDHLAEDFENEAHSGLSPEQPSVEALRSAAIDCMRNSQSGGDSAGAMAVVIAGEWVQNLAQLSASLEQPANAAMDAASIQWWR